MPIRALIFDLDGTLLDTLEDLADAANACLLAEGLSAHPVDAYRHFVGDGVETLFRRALPPGIPPGGAAEKAVAALVARMREEYGARWSAKTGPYPGICELLAALAPTGLPLGVLSNKPHAFTRLMVGSFFGGAGEGAESRMGDAAGDDVPLGPFAVVAGARPGVPRKPDPAAAIATARALGVDPVHVAFVGDSNVDMRTAHGAGMLAVGCLWGFRGEAELRESGAAVLLAHPLDLLRHL